MDQILKAQCSCGFISNDFFAGGGMRNFDVVCNAPSICVNCEYFFTDNYFNKSIICPKCKSDALFYDDPYLQIDSDDSRMVFSWHLQDGRVFTLPRTTYYCPDRKKKRMYFKSIGTWD